MRLQGRSTARQWARVALKCGLLLTDTKLWTSIGEQLRDRATDIGDEVQRRYEDTADRLHEARTAWQQPNRGWINVASFIGGLGVGVGAGLLLAPVSGEEARAALRNKVVDIKNKAGNAASDAYSRVAESGD